MNGRGNPFHIPAAGFILGIIVQVHVQTRAREYSHLITCQVQISLISTPLVLRKDDGFLWMPTKCFFESSM